MDQCTLSFESYVGGAFATSFLGVGYSWPGERSWNEIDDRDIVCTLYDLVLRRIVGSMQDSGGLDLIPLRVGDCFQEVTSATTIDADTVHQLPVIPSNQPHDNEIFFLFEVEDGDWPGDGFLETTADQACLARFEAYVGRDYATSRLDFYYFGPSQLSWERLGDREIVCILYDFDLEPLLDSMRDSGE